MSYQDETNPNAPPPPPAGDVFQERYEEDRRSYDRSAPPPQQSGGCSKGCLYGAAGCGCVSILTAAVIFGVGWYFANQAMKGFSNDPAVVRTSGKEIAEFDVPADLEPKMKMSIFFTKMVFFQSADGQSVLMLMNLDKQVGGGQKGNIREDFERGFKQGAQNDQRKELKVEKSEVKDLKIRGVDTKVTFSEAKDPAGRPFRIVEAGFEGKAGHVEMHLHYPEGKYKDEDIQKMLESIK